MLDIRFIRENPDVVKADLKKRNDREKSAWVDDLVKKDAEYRRLLAESQELRARRNNITREINELKKQGRDIKNKVEEAKNLPERIKQTEKRLGELKEKLVFYLMRIPNVLHNSVPVGKDASDNKVIRKWGKIKKFDFKLKSHGELIEELGLGDFSRGAKISGAGFYYLKGDLALLDLALQRFAVDFLLKKGFTLVEPPLMMNRRAYEGVTSLEDFEKVMYKIEGMDSYLIATSEHPMAAMFMNDVLDEDKLPIKFCGVSSCFRKEIGSHGIDTRGLFRVHQFNKVEQFVFCKPSESWKLFEEIQKNSEEMYKKLGIPFRVVSICTADIGIIAAKKYDIEAYSPRDGSYFEVGSNSNCTAYQATRLSIKYQNKKGERGYLNTLNNTAIATSRTMRAIIENYQEKDGSVRVPVVLQKYMNGKKIIKKQ